MDKAHGTLESMARMKVIIEMDVEVVDSEALQVAAAQTVYDLQREADRSAREFTSDAGPESMIEATQVSDAAALAHLLQLELPYRDGWPGARLYDSVARVYEESDPDAEWRVHGKRKAGT